MVWLALLAAVQVWIADESEKVRPFQTPPAAASAPRIRLAAAGGECAGAQIVVRGSARELKAVATSWLDLYRVATITVTQPSGPDGAIGEWPDALIPARDALYGEERRAFPADAEAGRPSPVLGAARVPRRPASARIA